MWLASCPGASAIATVSDTGLHPASHVSMLVP